MEREQTRGNKDKKRYIKPKVFKDKKKEKEEKWGRGKKKRREAGRKGDKGGCQGGKDRQIDKKKKNRTLNFSL